MSAFWKAALRGMALPPLWVACHALSLVGLGLVLAGTLLGIGATRIDAILRRPA